MLYRPRLRESSQSPPRDPNEARMFPARSLTFRVLQEVSESNCEPGGDRNIDLSEETDLVARRPGLLKAVTLVPQMNPFLVMNGH